MVQQQNRWEALDILRGLSVIGMLLNLNPGAWEHEYNWLVHAKWEGGSPIDMVAPVFLFCIGVAIPLSLQRRFENGAGKGKVMVHILWRSTALILLGLVLNAYPDFDFAHMRLPGVLQRIGLGFGVVSIFVLFVSKQDTEGRLLFRPGIVAAAAVFVLLSYWLLLYVVPVPGFGAPRFDPVGSWPAFIDRAVFGTDHMFKYWPVDGKITFDPDGLLSAYPVWFNMLLGVLVGFVHLQNTWKRPVVTMLLAGVSFMALALLLSGICPIIKNIWTGTFALFSVGFALAALAGLTVLCRTPGVQGVLFPARVFGANPLLAYIICWLLMPLLDFNWLSTSNGLVSIRYGSQLMLRPFMDVSHASFLFGIGYLSIVFALLWYCHRKRWFLKL